MKLFTDYLGFHCLFLSKFRITVDCFVFFFSLTTGINSLCVCVCVCVSMLAYFHRADRISKTQTIPGSLDIAVDNIPLEHPSMMMMSWFLCTV